MWLQPIRRSALLFVVVLVVTIAMMEGCSAPQIAQSCQESAPLLAVAKPYVVVAPPEVQAAVSLLAVGTFTCAYPEYVAARDRMIAYLSTLR